VNELGNSHATRALYSHPRRHGNAWRCDPSQPRNLPAGIQAASKQGQHEKALAAQNQDKVRGVIGLYTEAKTHWLWTEKAERQAKAKHIHRLAGSPVMDYAHGKGAYTKKVPKSWVENGYVKEADPEQETLF